MTSLTRICNLTELRTELIALFESEWFISNSIATSIYDDMLLDQIRRFKPNVNFVIETPYVDKVYRDSYYTYFSTKLGNYKKDCIRLSFFDGPLTVGDFRDLPTLSNLQNRYWGFMVLRPTIPSVIGRSVITPQALRDDDFLCVTSSYPSSVHAVKLLAKGFPHSSQDAETISCAETSIWAIMEYFSSRYAEYKPAPPSMIIQAIKSRSNVRQIPSEGLQVDQIGFALREFGFATKIYSRIEFGDIPFRRLFSTYIESGLPLIVAMDNNHQMGTIGHALIAIGHTSTTDQLIDNLPVSQELDSYLNNLIGQQGIQFFDNDDVPRRFVFIDDNMPPYQLQDYETPGLHYNDPDWEACRITHFIVPMYPKMYLEAVEAKSHIKTLLLEGNFPIVSGVEIFLRLFLTSSRSYKDYLARESSFNADIQDFILETPMPKFIWVAEISDRANIKRKQAHGLFILDATEPNLENYNALIFGGYQDTFCYPDHASKELIINSLTLGTFNIYLNNLKGF